MTIERLTPPIGFRLSRRNVRFLARKARRRFRGNTSLALRTIIDEAEKRDAKRRKRERGR